MAIALYYNIVSYKGKREYKPYFLKKKKCIFVFGIELLLYIRN